jgi:hypothetical protein
MVQSDVQLRKGALSLNQILELDVETLLQKWGSLPANLKFDIPASVLALRKGAKFKELIANVSHKAGASVPCLLYSECSIEIPFDVDEIRKHLVSRHQYPPDMSYVDIFTIDDLRDVKSLQEKATTSKQKILLGTLYSALKLGNFLIQPDERDKVEDSAEPEPVIIGLQSESPNKRRKITVGRDATIDNVTSSKNSPQSNATSDAASITKPGINNITVPVSANSKAKQDKPNNAVSTQSKPHQKVADVIQIMLEPNEEEDSTTILTKPKTQVTKPVINNANADSAKIPKDTLIKPTRTSSNNSVNKDSTAGLSAIGRLEKVSEELIIVSPSPENPSISADAKTTVVQKANPAKNSLGTQSLQPPKTAPEVRPASTPNMNISGSAATTDGHAAAGIAASPLKTPSNKPKSVITATVSKPIPTRPGTVPKINPTVSKPNSGPTEELPITATSRTSLKAQVNTERQISEPVISSNARNNLQAENSMAVHPTNSPRDKSPQIYRPIPETLTDSSSRNSELAKKLSRSIGKELSLALTDFDSLLASKVLGEHQTLNRQVSLGFVPADNDVTRQNQKSTDEFNDAGPKLTKQSSLLEKKVKDSIQELEALAEKLNTSLANQANRSLIEIKATVLAQINNLAKALESMKAYRNSIDRVDAASRKKFEDLFQKEQGSLNGWKKVTEDEISNKLKKFESTLNEKAKHLDSSSHLSVQLQQQSKKCSELEEKVSTLERLVAALIHGKITNVAQVAVKDGTSVRDNQRRGKLSEEIDVILGLN